MVFITFTAHFYSKFSPLASLSLIFNTFASSQHLINGYIMESYVLRIFNQKIIVIFFIMFSPGYSFLFCGFFLKILLRR